MNLKIGSWNLGCCLIREPTDSPTDHSCYTHDGKQHIVDGLKKHDFDVVLLQEVPEVHDELILERIANQAGFKNYANFITCPSHLEMNSNLGVGILSKYPLTDIQRTMLLNPRKTVMHDGVRRSTYDRGFLSAHIVVDDADIRITTLQLLPFRHFNMSVHSPIFKMIFEDFDNKYTQHGTNREIVMGDFNVDSEIITPLLPLMKAQEFQEVPTPEPTKFAGLRVDHTLYKGFDQPETSFVDDVLTDHKIVSSTFTL